MTLTTAQAFGTSANLSGGTLTIYLADLAAQGLDTPDAAAKIIAALIKRWNELTNDKGFDPAYGIVVGNPSRQSVTRSGQNHISYSYSVRLYTLDSAPETPDPDNVIAA